MSLKDELEKLFVFIHTEPPHYQISGKLRTLIDSAFNVEPEPEPEPEPQPVDSAGVPIPVPSTEPDPNVPNPTDLAAVAASVIASSGA